MRTHYIIGKQISKMAYKYMDYRNDYTVDDPLHAAKFPSMEDINRYFPAGVAGEIYMVETRLTLQKV